MKSTRVGTVTRTLLIVFSFELAAPFSLWPLRRRDPRLGSLPTNQSARVAQGHTIAPQLRRLEADGIDVLFAFPGIVDAVVGENVNAPIATNHATLPGT